MSEIPIPLPRRNLTSTQKKPIPAPRYTTPEKANASLDSTSTASFRDVGWILEQEIQSNLAASNVDAKPEKSFEAFHIQNTSFVESIIENDEIPELRHNENNSKRLPSKSVILEFDPLAELSTDDEEDVQSSSTTLASIRSAPPTPPERIDSLPEETVTVTKAVPIELARSQSTSSWFTDLNNENNYDPRKRSHPSLVQRFSKVFLGNRNQKEVVCRKPDIRETTVAPYSSMIKVQKNQRYAVISGGSLTCYAGTTNANVKETFNLSDVCSLQLILEGSSSEECIEMCLLSGTSYNKVRLNCSPGERCIWMQRIIEHMSEGFKQKNASKCTRFGWCFVKTGVCSPWQGAWLMLVDRTLLYFSPVFDEAPTSLDLRKLRVLSSKQVEEQQELGDYPSPRSDRVHLLDFPDKTLYIMAPRKQECKLWSDLINSKRKSGSRLHEQLLTANDVPVIVQKCIDFVYAHGSLSEGIYRRAGSSTNVTSLLTSFRKDAHSVTLQKSEHSEHDVATVLKKFLRDLPDPLIDCREALIGAKEITNEENRHIAYSKAMGTMNPIRRATVKRLFAHLNFIHSARDHNRMSAANLAAVWSPTLMPTVKEGEWGTHEADIIRELIIAYPRIWRGTDCEALREKRLRDALLKLQSNSATPFKQAGDLRIWVYVLKHNQDSQHAVILSPGKTCSDLCEELNSKTAFPPHKLMVEEIILQGTLNRWMVGTDSPLETVARWGYWPEKHRKDNYLMVKDDTPLRLLETLKEDVMDGLIATLKYASPKAKAFRQHSFELKNGTLFRYNDGKESDKSVAESWRIEDLVWYSGCENGRDAGASWSMTFIDKQPTTLKSDGEGAFFGHTLGGSGGEEERLQWLAAFAFAKHATLLTEPKLIQI